MEKYIFKYISGNSYNIKILLTENFKDLGYFDPIDDPLSNVNINPYYSGSSIVTGTSRNLLENLRTYSTSNDLSKRYITSTSPAFNGLDLSLTISATTFQKYVYYINGLTYITFISGNTSNTIYSYITTGDNNSELFLRLPVIKDEKKLNQITSPSVNSEIFIERQIKSVFENNYRLSDIDSLTHLLSYGGGYYNIIKNT